jgi:excisionase family DNA binding protein
MPTLLDTVAVADMLAVSVATLRRWRREGGGPDFVRIGRAVRYQAADVNRWIAQHRIAQQPKEPGSGHEEATHDPYAG